MPSSRRNHTRSYRTTTRGSSSRSRRRYEEPSGGGGGTLLILIGVILIVGYLLMDEEALGKAQGLMHQAKTVFQEKMLDESMIPVSVTPCTQAQIAKILVYTLEEGDIPETAVNENWYSKYYKLLGEESRFDFLREENATNPITYQETLDILKIVAGDGYQVSVATEGSLGSQTIQLKDFLVAYEQALNYGNVAHGLNYQELSILGTLTTNSMLSAWQVATNNGIYGFEGLIMDPFKDYTLKVVTKGSEILGVVETVSNQSTIEKCYIQSVQEGKATVQVGTLTFSYDAPMLTEKDEGSIGRIIVQNSQIIDFELQLDKDTDVVVRIDEKTIEFEKAGTLPYDKVLVYNGVENGVYNDLSQLFSGVKVAYTLEGNKVHTLKVIDDTVRDEIRVLLSEDGLGQYNHGDVTVTSEGTYTVTYNGKVTEIAANTPWEASKFSWEKSRGKVTVQSKSGDGIYVQSMTRQGIHPQYKGRLEIYPVEEGYQVVNTLPIEDYIAGVIPSEMPSNYGLEAAKVQAIAARSFARSHSQSSKFMKYGAQVDDTVSTQVYNRVKPDATSYQAAKETEGEVLVHNGKIISGNFFATSCGYTANFGETWANGEIFPTNTPVYLVARQQYIGNRLVDDLSNEKDAYSFFTKKPEEVNAFDSKSPWFRWQVQVDGEELSQMINTNVYKLTTQYPNMVKVQNKENKWVVGELNHIGKIEDIQITKRGSGGNIMEMTVEGEEATIKIATEYLVRSLLAPLQIDGAKDPIKVVRADGSEIENMAMLPSAFFSMDIAYDDKNNITGATIYGGGFGHGVGMSQDGVKGMSEMGYTYREILRHYYAGAEIKKM